MAPGQKDNTLQRLLYVYETGFRRDGPWSCTFEVSVFPATVSHLPSQATKQAAWGMWVAAPQSPTWPCRRVQSHPDGLSCMTGWTTRHHTGRQQLLEGCSPHPPLRPSVGALLPTKSLPLTPCGMPAQADPELEWDPWGWGKAEERKRPTGAGRGTEGLERGLPPLLHRLTERCGSATFIVSKGRSGAGQEPRPQERCWARRRTRSPKRPPQGEARSPREGPTTPSVPRGRARTASRRRSPAARRDA